MLEAIEWKDKNDDINNNPIIIQLIEFGINPIFCKRIFLFYHPTNIDDALDYLSYKNGQIQHNFVQNRNNLENGLCYLCGESRNIHINNNLSVNISKNSNEENISSSISNENEIKNSIHDISIKIGSQNTHNSISTHQEIECPTCLESYHPNENNTIKKCGHSFCNDCWYNFLSIKIQENKLTSIKCLDYKCQEKPNENFIINLLNSDNNLIKKYKRFKLNLEIINDPNKKLCPYPNCDSYLELKNIANKDVKCLNNHNYCFLCLNEPHGKLPCNSKMKDSLAEYAKNNFLKKCPNCNIITEKNSGCNHITCTKCNYQWCWLCNGKYSNDHFTQGKCKGYQFFQPKDEYDIKLAFEGKIQLEDSQIQESLNDIEEEQSENNNNNNNNNIFHQSISFDANSNNSENNRISDRQSVQNNNSNISHEREKFQKFERIFF